MVRHKNLTGQILRVQVFQKRVTPRSRLPQSYDMMRGLVLAKQQQIYKVSMIRFASSKSPKMATFDAQMTIPRKG